MISSIKAPTLFPWSRDFFKSNASVCGATRTESVFRRSRPLGLRPAPFLAPPCDELWSLDNMVEVQRHGFDFQQWVIRSFFAPFQEHYTAKWDVPSESNSSQAVPDALRALPVSIKTCKNGSPVGFGDALRQFALDEDFLLIVGFWEQAGPFKNYIATEAVKVTVAQWRRLLDPITANALHELDVMIKDRTLHYSKVRELARVRKSQRPFSDARMVLNPKIDSKVQRRLQCSLPFEVFWEMAGKQPYSNVKSSLFGRAVPNPFSSQPRTFQR